MIGVEAGKHPGKPLRAFFIDSENGAAKLLEGMEFLTRSDTVIVFHRGSFPPELKNKLELGPSAVEWVKCVDQGVKNSMDVQIIVELALRFAEDGFKSAYIVSEDKGFLPAVHYLQQTPKGRGREIALVKNISHAAMRAVLSTLTDLKRADNVKDVEDALAPLYGEGEASDLTRELERIFASTSPSATNVLCDETMTGQARSDGAGQNASDREEKAAGSASFIDLPGIGRMLADKLESAGIASPAELERIGAVEAWRRIYHSDASFPPKWVYSFEAAIKGVPVNSIDPKRKRRLKSDIKAFVSKRECAA